jgi:hypothetical protein
MRLSSLLTGFQAHLVLGLARRSGVVFHARFVLLRADLAGLGLRCTIGSKQTG